MVNLLQVADQFGLGVVLATAAIQSHADRRRFGDHIRELGPLPQQRQSRPALENFISGFARVSFGFFAGVLPYRLRDRMRLPRIASILLLIAVPALFAIVIPRPAQIAVAILVLRWFFALGSVVEPRGLLESFCKSVCLASYAIYALRRRIFVLGYGPLLKFVCWDAQSVVPWGGCIFRVVLAAGCTLIDRIYNGPARRWLTRLAARWRTARTAEA